MERSSMPDAEPDGRAWLARAEEDLVALRAVVSADRVAWGVALFLAQQAVEKALKGLLLSRKVLPGRTHDLVGLLARCVEIQPDLVRLTEACGKLAAFGAEIRYPDSGFLPSADDAREAVGLAEPIVGEIRKLVS